MSDHDLEAGLQNTMSGVLLNRALRERRDALDRVAELEARLRRIEEAARDVDKSWFATVEGDNVRMRYASDLPGVLNALRAALEEKP